MASRSGRSWGSLTPSYRDRLERAGVSQRDYEAGADVQRARGHREREHAYTRLRAEIRPLLVGLPQRAQLERKLRNLDLDPRGVRDLALATAAAQAEWRGRGGDRGGAGGSAGASLGQVYDDIYDLYDWPEDERDVDDHYHEAGGD